MDHTCCRISSNKNGSTFAFKQSKVTDKKYCPVSRSAAVNMPSIRCGETHGHVKIKRLKTNRQRNQLRGGAQKASRSNHHHCQHPRSTDIKHLHMCCQSSCSCPSRRVVPLPVVFPAAQVPSVITDNRLTGHQGLFNREVRSVDIDRLLNPHRNMKKNLQETPKKKNVPSHSSSVSYLSPPFCTNQRSKDDESLRHAKNNNASAKSSDIYKEGKSAFESDTHVTPAQRPQQQLGPPLKSRNGRIPSSHSSLSAAVFKSRRNQSDICKKARLCSMKGTSENPCSAISNTQTRSLCSKPVTPSSPQNSEVFDFRHRRPQLDRASQSIKKVAARLCDGLRFPYLRRGNLVAEGRKVLLKALDKSHGPHLQENLLQLKQDFGFSSDPTSEGQGQEMSSSDMDDFLLAAGTATGTKKHNYTHQGTFGNTKSCESSNSQQQHNLKQFLTFEPFGVVDGDNFFAPSTPCGQADKTVASQHWEDRRPKTKEDLFGPFENPFLSHSSHRHLHHYHQKNPFLLDGKSPFQNWSHLTDMASYPPSHMLEGDSGRSLFSSPDLQHWSFPPMRMF